MAKPRKRRVSRLPRERREADILAAARIVFRLRGYENASISEIAERAGIVEGSIYRYFTNKRELLIRVIEEWYSGMIAEDEAHLASVQGTWNRLRHVVWHHLKVLHEEPGLSRLVFTEFRPDSSYRQTRIFALNRRYTTRLMDVARAGIAAGEFRSDVSPALVRDMIFGCIEHHTWAFLRGERDFDIEKTADSITSLVCQGLASEAPAAKRARPASLKRARAR